MRIRARNNNGWERQFNDLFGQFVLASECEDFASQVICNKKRAVRWRSSERIGDTRSKNLRFFASRSTPSSPTICNPFSIATRRRAFRPREEDLLFALWPKPRLPLRPGQECERTPNLRKVSKSWFSVFDGVLDGRDLMTGQQLLK
jgi:hypothetical protein